MVFGLEANNKLKTGHKSFIEFDHNDFERIVL